MAGMHRVETFNRLYSLREKLHDFRRKTGSVAESLQDVANEFQKAFQDVKKASIAGSTASVVGGILATVGFGLSFATFGSSLILTAVGAGIGAAGGITAGGAAIGQTVQKKRAYQQAKELIENYEATRIQLLTEFDKISELLGPDNLDTTFHDWNEFIGNLVLGFDICKTVGVSGKSIYTVIKSALLIKTASELPLDIGNSGGRITAASLNTTSAAGGIVGIIFLPINIGFLVHSAHAVATDKVSDTTKEIVNMAEKLKKMCPSARDINDAIDKTIYALSLFYIQSNPS